MIPTFQIGGLGLARPSGGGSGSTAAAILAKLGSWWEMDEASGTRLDSHGSNDLTVSGTVSTGAGARGTDVAAQFAGAGSLSVANNTSLNVPPKTDHAGAGGDHCFFGWFYLNANTGTQFIGAKWNASGAPQLEYGVSFQSGLIYGQNGGTSYTSVPTFAPTAAAWHFVVVWRDWSDGKVRVQIDNGTIYTSGSGSNPDAAAASALQFGGVNGNFPVSGRVQRWGWMKNAFMTSGERAYLYAAGAGVTYVELVASA